MDRLLEIAGSLVVYKTQRVLVSIGLILVQQATLLAYSLLPILYVFSCTSIAMSEAGWNHYSQNGIISVGEIGC